MIPNLLKGNDPALAGENMRMLRQSGLSEADAASTVMRGESMSERESKIRRAVQDHVSPPKKGKNGGGGAEPCCGPSDSYCYVKDIFDQEGFAIVEKGQDMLKVPFTMNGDQVVCGTPTPVKEVKSYEPTAGHAAAPSGMHAEPDDDEGADAASDDDADDEY